MSLKALGFILKGARCPDGVELVDFGDAPKPKPSGEWFRFRTERKESFRLEITDLTNPVVIRFLNSRDDLALAEFSGRYGMPIDLSDLQRLPRARKTALVAYQEMLRSLVAVAASGDLPSATTEINKAFKSTFQAMALAPSIDLGGAGGSVRMMYTSTWLLHFMMMETATIAMNGARLAFCKHCGDAFLTGHMTGRRAHAEYCSDRCRTAAMRDRKSKAGSV